MRNFQINKYSRKIHLHYPVRQTITKYRRNLAKKKTSKSHLTYGTGIHLKSVARQTTNVFYPVAHISSCICVY